MLDEATKLSRLLPKKEADYFAKMIPPSSFTNEAREAMANVYNGFKKGK